MHVVVMVVMHHVVVVGHVVAMVMHRLGRGQAGRHGERDGGRKRQSDEFQGFFSRTYVSPESLLGDMPR
jgi:hypothetical protein